VSDWIKDGECIIGTYMGQSVSGVVVESRVKYGGAVQYTVDLDSPIQLRWRSEPTVRVLLNSNELAA